MEPVYNRGALKTPPRALLALPLAAVVILTLPVAACRRAPSRPPRLSLAPPTVLADGYSTSVLEIQSYSSGSPEVSVSENPHAVRIEDTVADPSTPGRWQTHIRVGVMGGRFRLRVRTPGAPYAEVELEALINTRDTAGDGTPDFLRLEEHSDKQNFRRWFTFLAEAQYFQAPASRPAEINDCAALIRYAYREALRAHDSGWASSAKLPLIPPYESVDKFQYPYTPLGASLFRVRPGRFEPADATNGAFAQFADAQTLWRLNTTIVGRNIRAALPGDLLFYRQQDAREPYHSMVYLGESLIRPDGKRYILYHTGPTGSDPGEMRRLTVEELLTYPQAQWRPIAENPGFLGVFRWNILEDSPR